MIAAQSIVTRIRFVAFPDRTAFAENLLIPGNS
jgi:hypothetical protein